MINTQKPKTVDEAAEELQKKLKEMEKKKEQERIRAELLEKINVRVANNKKPATISDSLFGYSDPTGRDKY